MLLGDQTPTVEVGVQETPEETWGEILVETLEEGEILVETPEEGEILEEDRHHTKEVTD